MDHRKILTEDVLPFWLTHGMDGEHGGIITCLDRQGDRYGTEKSVWFQGRALWTFATAYNMIEQNPAYLAAAKSLYDFLPRCTDTDGRMFFTVTREGDPIQKRRYFFSETFAAIGCAQYYKATKDPAVWQRAEQYFAVARRCFEDPSRNPPKYRTASKALSPVMIMMATARAMAGCADDPAPYEALARTYANEVLHGGFISDEANAVLETVSPDGKFCDTPGGRTVNPGHSLETAWFLLVEGLLTDNDETLHTAKKIIDITMPLGWDKKHGGIIAFCDAKGKPAGALEWDMKLWWPQNEAIIANRLAYAIFGDERYRETFEMIRDYAFSHFTDPDCGEWYGYLHYDSTPSTTLKGNIFKGPFHLPRMLMILDTVERGNITDFFVNPL